MHTAKRSIAVIGGGVAGLVAAYALSARDRVTLFEADTRVGGHAHTHYLDRGAGDVVGVDSAVLVHNARTNPTLCRLFDAVVIATHPDQALLMLTEPTAAERDLLGAMPYSTTLAQLHTDESVLPRNPRARASWNYLMTESADRVLVSYDFTRLMRLDGPHRFVVTLGGHDVVNPDTVIAEIAYSLPMCTVESVAAQRFLPTLNDSKVVFAGAYHGRGFHEDGAASGLQAARHLGADWPTQRAAVEAVAC